MSSFACIVITVLINFFMLEICDMIDLKNRKNTNTVVYLIGYTIGCVIMTMFF